MSVCDQIASAFGSLFSCSEVRDYVRIRTPYLYPDGDVLDLFYKLTETGAALLTDLGETTRWLRSVTPSLRRSAKQKQLIQEICAANHVEFYKGALLTRIAPGDNLAEKVTQLAQAAIRVSDIYITFRTSTTQSFADEVAEFLDEHEIEYVRNEHLIGRSGRSYKVDFHTFMPRRTAYMDVLSTGSRQFAKISAEHTYTTWSDLINIKTESAIRFVTLFDDAFDVWAPEDYTLLSSISDVSTWSQPEELIQLLSAA